MVVTVRISASDSKKTVLKLIFSPSVLLSAGRAVLLLLTTMASTEVIFEVHFSIFHIIFSQGTGPTGTNGPCNFWPTGSNGAPTGLNAGPADPDYGFDCRDASGNACAFDASNPAANSKLKIMTELKYF